MTTIDDVRRAAETICGRTVRTPLVSGGPLDALAGRRLLLKLENLQVTGAFKIRGVLTRFAALTPAERAAGVICSTSGSHGLAVGQVARWEGIKALVVVPEVTPEYKIEKIRRLAPVEIHGSSYHESSTYAVERAAREGLTYLASFDDPHIIAGQGTISLEVLQEAGDVDVIVVPIGGGGLAAGTIATAKALRPGVRVVGVEAVGAASMAESRKRGELVELPAITTSAESIAVKRPGKLTFAMVKEGIDDIVLVTDDEMKEAVRLLFSEVKIVAELGAAASLAAVLTGRVTAPGAAACVISGGNISGEQFARIVGQPGR